MLERQFSNYGWSEEPRQISVAHLPPDRHVAPNDVSHQGLDVIGMESVDAPVVLDGRNASGFDDAGNIRKAAGDLWSEWPIWWRRVPWPLRAGSCRPRCR